MGSSQTKITTSFSLDSDVVEALRDAEELNNSRLANTLLREYLEESNRL